MNSRCRWLLASIALGVLGWASTSVAQTSVFAEEPVVTMVKSNDLPGLQRALLRGESPNTRDGSGIPALAVAAQFGALDAVNALLQFKANIDILDTEGNTALAHAAARGHLDIVRVLLAAKAQVNRENRQGETPLMLAARSGRVDVVAELLKAGAAVDAADYAGHTAVYHARVNRQPRVLRLLQEAGGKE